MSVQFVAYIIGPWLPYAAVVACAFAAYVIGESFMPTHLTVWNKARRWVARAKGKELHP